MLDFNDRLPPILPTPTLTTAPTAKIMITITLSQPKGNEQQLAIVLHRHPPTQHLPFPIQYNIN
jgi:hypothetical protein